MRLIILSSRQTGTSCHCHQPTTRTPSPPLEGWGEEVPIYSPAAEPQRPIRTPLPIPLPVRRGEGEATPRSLSALIQQAVAPGPGHTGARPGGCDWSFAVSFSYSVCFVWPVASSRWLEAIAFTRYRVSNLEAAASRFEAGRIAVLRDGLFLNVEPAPCTPTPLWWEAPATQFRVAGATQLATQLA